LLKDRLFAATKEDVLEQIIGFILSKQYIILKSLADHLIEKAKPFLDISGTWGR